MSITKDKVKNHLRKHHVKYIVGGTVVLGTASLFAYYKRLPTSQLNLEKYAAKIAAIDSSIDVGKLQFATIENGQFLGMIPDAVAQDLPIAEAMKHRVGPIIYGAAVVAAKLETDEIVAVFPINK